MFLIKFVSEQILFTNLPIFIYHTQLENKTIYDSAGLNVSPKTHMLMS